MFIQAGCHVLSKRPHGDDEEWKDLPLQDVLTDKRLSLSEIYRGKGRN